MSKPNGAGPQKKLLQLLFPTTPVLGALTIANHPEAKTGMHLLRGIVTRKEEALPYCNLLVETTVQGVLAARAGAFKQFHSDKPVVICSEERAPQYQKRDDIRTLISSIPLRCDEYPRNFQEAKWVEPMCATSEQVLYKNPEWLDAKFEIEFHCDPDKIFYDSVPIELFQGKKSFLFYVSGDITVVDDAVEALVVLRNSVDKTAAVSS